MGNAQNPHHIEVEEPDQYAKADIENTAIARLYANEEQQEAITREERKRLEQDAGVIFGCSSASSWADKAEEDKAEEDPVEEIKG